MNISSIANETALSPSPETIGQISGQISVELSTRFLEHFSEQPYSSPQKAFEELISNVWDAGADCVDVRISTDLTDPNATMYVLDNAPSMNEERLRQLWRIAISPKVVNKAPPFVEEHSQTKAEKELVRTIAMVELLSDIYALDIGVDPSILANIREYRDRLMRFRALQRRQSGTYIARLPLETQPDSETHRRLEAVVSDALRYIGFHVRDLAKSGEPEGIASAYPIPIPVDPTSENPHPPLYSFSFDAKSSKDDAAKTGNIKLDGVVEHRKRYKANYALVVAPGFSGKAIATRCAQQKVTPMTAHDLGRLLQYTVEYGAIPLTKLKDVFRLYNPSAVSVWVEGLGGWVRKQRKLTIDIFLKALKNLSGKAPEALPAGVISYECRENLNAISVKDADVIAVAQGLAILIPDLVGVSGDKIVVNASAKRVAAAVNGQLEKLHNERTVEIKNGEGGV